MSKKPEKSNKKRGIHLELTKTDIVWLGTILLFFIIALELFYRMIVKYNGKYPSDVRYYAISTIKNGDWMGRFVNLISKLLYSINQSTMEFNFFIAALIPTIIVMNYLVIKFFLKDDLMDERIPRHFVQLASILAIFTGPVYIPVFHEYYYMHSFSAFAWHSPTQHAMMVLSMAATLCFFEMFINYEKKEISPKWWAATSLLMVLSASSKPSFVIEFILCVVVIFLIELLSGGKIGLVKRFGRLFIMGSSLVPSGLYIIWLNTFEFGEEGATGANSKVLFGLEQALSHHNVIWTFVYGMPFVILVLIANWKRLKDKKYFVALMTFIMGVFQWLFFKEDGPRAKHGNFEWGRMYAIYFLVLVCLALFLENIYYPNSIFPNSRRARKIYLIIALVILGLSVLSQMNYFGYVLSGRKYMR